MKTPVDGTSAIAIEPGIVWMSVEDYLAAEERSLEKHEYIDGYVRAMAGASKNHERISLDLAVNLVSHLRGQPCEVFKADIKVHVQILDKRFYFYPDLVVTCDVRDKDNSAQVDFPKLIVEVYSEGNLAAALDKLSSYRAIPTLEEYVLISCDPAKPLVTIFRRDNRWQPVQFSEGELQLDSIHYRLPFADLYARL
ncbi:Uma2 family endonuclease [Roseibacillus ishigakijimensis]|uniref:Uma2 family endonuclease n=1 Tax=Roseibacillus ishigakijimensis TaxID=454146 RepID=A0A934RNK7_9BACT|nr:Uma2 family endonuclease [Roseibacillus ishigakijimensis]MBK1832947.1 Uma2 family endonuclease [Roseibacillus ishigakijimensis]